MPTFTKTFTYEEDIEVEVSYQDDGRTVKVFVKDAPVQRTPRPTGYVLCTCGVVLAGTKEEKEHKEAGHFDQEETGKESWEEDIIDYIMPGSEGVAIKKIRNLLTKREAEVREAITRMGGEEGKE